jgi:xylulokinase
VTSSVPRALGIDVGTTNTKVVLLECSADGARVVARASAATPAPAALAGILRELIRPVVANQPAPGVVGIASMAETGVPLGPAGAPLGDWLRWDGHRAGREAEYLAARLGREQLITTTGVRPGPKVPLATWAWLRAQHAETFTAMTRWAGAADLACLLLTCRLATDHTLAGRTMGYRLPAPGQPPAGQFDADLVAEVGLRSAQLPDVVTGVAGTVVKRGWPEVGLPAGIPVTVAGHDHQVGAYAGGMRRAGHSADSVGTAEAVLTLVDTPPDPLAVAAAGMSSVITVDGAHRALLSGSPSAGGFVRWWLDHEAAGADPDELFASVLDRRDEPSEVLVLPYPHGRQAPAPDPDAPVAVLGRRAGHDQAELAWAMLQGLCLQARWLLDEQQRLAGIAGSGADGLVVALGGPLLGNPAWLRLKTLITPRPLRVLTEPEAVAAGAALVGAVRAGLVPNSGAVLAHWTASAPARHRAGYDRALAAFITAATDSTRAATDITRGAPT